MVNVTVSSAGTSGPRGNGIQTGTGAPASTVGIDGDWYIDAAALKLYGPRAGGVWPSTGTAMSASAAGALLAANNLSDLGNAGTARTNLGLGSAAVANVGTAAGTVAAGNDSRITGAAQTANNLSDLASSSTARTNLGLGGAATLSVGTAAGTVAAGNDSRITGALQGGNNLSDVASAATARTNLGLTGAATAALPLTVANGGTGAGSASAGLAALGGQPVSAVRSITSATATASPYDVLQCNAATQAITVTPPANAAGVRFTVAKTDPTSNPVTISGTVGGVVNPTLSIPGQSMEVVGDGTLWYTAGQAQALDSSILFEPTLKLPKYGQPAAILSEFQAGHGFTSSGGTFTANDTTTYVRGSQCATLVTPGDSNTYYVTGSVSTYDTTSRVPRVTAQIADITTLSNLQIDLCTDTTWSNGWTWTCQGGATGSNYYTSGDWVTQTLSFHDAVKIGTGSRSGLAAVRIRIKDTGTAATVHLQAVDLVADGTQTWPNGVISITFDDVYQDALDNGKPRLDLYGYPATTFVIADRIGRTGRVTLTELKTLQDDNGWELSSHAYLDADHSATYTGLTAAQLDADARQMKAYAVQNGFRAADLVAYPLGQYGLTTDGASTTGILRKYFAAGLSTVAKTHETYPPSDAFRVRRLSAISSYTGGYAPTSLTQSGGDLDLCKANGSWLILAFHEVVTGAPTATTQIAQADFNSIIDGINSRGIPVVPVGEVLRYASVTSTATATIDTSDLPKKVGAIAATGSGPLAAPWDHVHPRGQWAPEDHGYITWAFDAVACASTGATPTAGTLQLVRLHVPVATTITNVVLFADTAGATLTSGQNFAALYTSAGSLLAATADQTTAWGTSGLKTMALTAAQAVSAGDYYVGFYANGTTTPAFARAVKGNSILNAGLSNASSRWATGATGLTTAMPASAGTLASSSNGYWAALS